jgi:hypothetical protein
MKTLKIKTKPIDVRGSKVAVGFGDGVQIIVVDEDNNETDITKGVRTVEVVIPTDDVITAKVEFYVQELDLEGIKVEEAL